MERRSWGIRWWIILLAMAGIWLTGCVDSGGGWMGDDLNAPGVPEVGQYSSAHYDVRVIGGRPGPKGPEMARHGALLMEKMYDVYTSLDESPLPPGEPMPFFLHLDRPEYDRRAAMYEFPAQTTNGFCTTGGEVHVYFKKSGKLPPEATAMHEGFHQYCHRALHYPTPREVFESVPGYKLSKIPTVPLWLAEGMAMNMESARIETDHNGVAVSIDDVGSVNAPRLAHLAELIKSGRCPSVRATLNLIMGDRISIDDYSVMWGIVFDFRVATGNSIFVREQKALERAGPQAVREAIDAAIDTSRPYPYMRWPVPVMSRFMRACRVAWGLDVQALIDACVRGAREPRDFDRQWNRRLTQAALAEVERLLRDQGETLEQWERGWQKRMLALNAEVRGGKYLYVEPMGVKDVNRPGFIESMVGEVEKGGRAPRGERGAGRRKAGAIGDWGDGGMSGASCPTN